MIWNAHDDPPKQALCGNSSLIAFEGYGRPLDTPDHRLSPDEKRE